LKDFSTSVQCRSGQSDKSDRENTIANEYETLRWPTNMDHAAIIERLVQVRAKAESMGQQEFADRFVDVETMPKKQLGATVVSALTYVQAKPEFADVATQLAMVAMNLKNLK
jgi:hypothetical protein